MVIWEADFKRRFQLNASWHLKTNTELGKKDFKKAMKKELRIKISSPSSAKVQTESVCSANQPMSNVCQCPCRPPFHLLLELLPSHFRILPVPLDLGHLLTPVFSLSPSASLCVESASRLGPSPPLPSPGYSHCLLTCPPGPVCTVLPLANISAFRVIVNPDLGLCPALFCPCWSRNVVLFLISKVWAARVSTWLQLV